jgi:hypothetical protein
MVFKGRLAQIGTTENDSEGGELVIEYAPKGQCWPSSLGELVFDNVRSAFAR